MVRLWRSPRRWPRGATNPVQIRWKSHVFFPLSLGRWPSLIRWNRFHDLTCYDLTVKTHRHIKIVCCEGMAKPRTVTAAHHLITCMTACTMHKSPKSKLKFVTLDKESNILVPVYSVVTRRRSDVLKIRSRKALTNEQHIFKE